MRFIRTLRAFAAFLLCAVVISSCKKDEPAYININPSSISLKSDANSTASVYLTSNGKWTASNIPDWISLSSTSGENNANLIITANSENTLTSSRSGRIEFKSGGTTTTLDVTQAASMRLEVNPSSISLVSSANAYATVNIICSTEWNVTSKPDWVNVSSTSGKGNTTLTITSLSENASASVRTGQMEIKSTNSSAMVEISQVAGLQSGCEVIITDEVILNTSATFRLNFGSKADYFYAGYFPSSSAGWSDDKLIAELEENGKAMNIEDDLDLTANSLEENETYIQCFVAYTENGKRGELLRRKFTTPISKNAPLASISKVKYNSSNNTMSWSTTIGATAQEYYMLVFTGQLAFIHAYLTAPSKMGMIFKDKEATLTSYVNSQDWYVEMDADEEDFLVATWAQRDKKWSSVLPMYYTDIDSKSGAADDSRITVMYRAEREEILKHIHIFK